MARKADIRDLMPASDETLRKNIEKEMSDIGFNPYSKDKKIVCADTGEVCTGDKYLKSRHWKQVRKDIYCYRNGNCQKCHRHLMFGLSRVHHLNYDNMGSEKKTDLMLLCDECHAEIHGTESRWQKRRREEIIRIIRTKDPEDIPPSILEGYEDLDLMDNPEKWFESHKVVVKATDKQIAFARTIAEYMHIDLPEKETKEEYSKFISENVGIFNAMKRGEE